MSPHAAPLTVLHFWPCGTWEAGWSGREVVPIAGVASSDCSGSGEHSLAAV